ncbi:KGG domain-containing protein [Chitinophaga alhagiae]|uniref:KGG domain-containing protein n=1 Tax=Chitinophaga alhagiae TaxID=2203219 RepID=UPI0018E57F83|nr:KGG domain-containing protein [Chitinophaga alhagiae]
MGTPIKTTEREAPQYRQRDDRSTAPGHTREADDMDEFDDDRNQQLEGYDENELDAADHRGRREAQEADGDSAAHERREVRTPSRRGFAAMDKEKQRMIASKGGKASHGGGRKPSKNR